MRARKHVLQHSEKQTPNSKSCNKYPHAPTKGALTSIHSFVANRSITDAQGTTHSGDSSATLHCTSNLRAIATMTDTPSHKSLSSRHTRANASSSAPDTKPSPPPSSPPPAYTQPQKRSKQRLARFFRHALKQANICTYARTFASCLTSPPFSAANSPFHAHSPFKTHTHFDTHTHPFTRTRTHTLTTFLLQDSLTIGAHPPFQNRHQMVKVTAKNERTRKHAKGVRRNGVRRRCGRRASY